MPAIEPATKCFHCGEDIFASSIWLDDKKFCCTGCATVYQVLNRYGLCDYYQYAENPGINQRQPVRQDKFAFLDSPSIRSQLLLFEDASKAQVCFYLPQMHCSSCLWLLEHLQNIHEGIISSRVDFNNKEVSVQFILQKISLRKLAELLTSIGYEPCISLNDLDNPKKNLVNRSLVYRLGVAGFCFGNIMMLSFPEYFGLSAMADSFNLKPIFQWLILGLSLPVFFYSAAVFFKSGWSAIRHGFLNIDAPIALAIAITFFRSIYEIVTSSGAGYLDSMSGIVFFMLAGRILQDRTRQSLSFDRDYSSYFPIAVNKLEDAVETPVSLPQLKSGDSIIIHSNEIVPADGILVRGNAIIDYSFVTGESTPVEKRISELIYAGGKQTAGKIELLLVKDVSQSYLTRLWNKASMHSGDNNEDSFVHQWSRYFTIALFLLAAIAASWWYLHDASKIWPVVTAILIVACPCALLLSNSFTNGHIINLFDKAKFYLRNASVLERMRRIDHIVFDKTGTLTSPFKHSISYYGDELADDHKLLVAALATQSNHPLSKAIANHLQYRGNIAVEHFKETPGKGCEAWMNDHHVVLGNPEHVWGRKENSIKGSIVAFRIDKDLNGFFIIQNKYRNGIDKMLQQLQKQFSLSVITGDNDDERQRLQQLTGTCAALHFSQSPEDKYAYIDHLQQHENVLMVGDGLNDAGALKRSLVGIAVTDNINNFSPACDAILDANQITLIPAFIKIAKLGKQIVTASFIISVGYNIIGLSFACTGSLSPMIAAILMPASSISIVIFTWVAVQLSAKKRLKNLAL